MTGVKPVMKRQARKLILPVFTVSTFLGAVVLAVLSFHSPVVPVAKATSMVKAASFLPQAQHQPAHVAVSDHPSMVKTNHPYVASVPPVTTYRVRSGDTLSKISHKLWGHASDWPRLWYANRHKVANPTILLTGMKLTIPPSDHVTPHVKHMALAALPQVTIPVSSATGSSGSVTVTTLPASSGGGGGTVLSPAQIGALWVKEGGSPSAVGTAECIAEHESGGNTQAISPTNDWGLFQINGGGQPMLDPVANTQRAIAMSGNGTNWGPWTTAGSCGV